MDKVWEVWGKGLHISKERGVKKEKGLIHLSAL